MHESVKRVPSHRVTVSNDALRFQNFEIVDEQGFRFDHFIVYCKNKYWNKMFKIIIQDIS